MNPNDYLPAEQMNFRYSAQKKLKIFLFKHLF